MPRDRLLNTDQLMTLRETRHLRPHHVYDDGYGYYTRPHVQFSKRSNWGRRKAVYERDDFTCQECGYRPPSDLIPPGYTGEHTVGALVIDHVVSLRDGGDRYGDNLRTLCTRCNGKKG